MKRTIKRTLSVILAMLFVMSVFSAGSDALAADEGYQKGDVIEFGSYPQTRVTDEETLAALDATEPEWHSYGYYSGSGNAMDGQMTASDYMEYADIEYNGQTYRGVYFSQYRPTYTHVASSANNSDPDLTYQDDNKYYVGIKYWFLWEPLQWRILDSDTGLVLCEKLIDSQAYNNYGVFTNNAHWGNAEHSGFLNDYEHSSIRKWLTAESDETSFLNTAFTEAQREYVCSTTLDNSAPNAPYSHYEEAYTTDKIFLLSYSDALDAAYGFSSETKAQDPARVAEGSDYAKSQGLFVDGHVQGRYSNWLLRTAGSAGYLSRGVIYDGKVLESHINSVCCGIRPAMRLDLVRMVGTNDRPASGQCGENVQWTFDEESGVLSLSGTGAMDSLGAFEDYGYSVWKDDIQFVAAADGVTSVGAHAFEGCPLLEEVILGEDVTVIGEAAFADCPRLMNVTLLSKTISADGAFPADRTDWMLVFPEDNLQATALAKRLGAAWVPVSYKDDILSFGGTITVHDDYAYSYLPMFVQRYGGAQKVYFNRLVFADVKAEDVKKQDYTGNTPDGCLTMYYVEVTLLYIDPDGEQEEITYDRMIELLQSGDYRAFKLRVTSTTEEGEEKTQEEIIEQKLTELFPHMPKKVLRLVSKAINFIVGIFKR